MNHYEIIKKLIGPISGVGCSNEDIRRFENLEATIALVDKLLVDIRYAAEDTLSHEASVQKIGKWAQAFLDEVREAT